MKLNFYGLLILFSLFSARDTLRTQVTLSNFFRDSKDAPLLICGHRGGSAEEAPENSLSRFSALAASFYPQQLMIELDVRKSADGELFVLHDATLGRTTAGTDSIHLVLAEKLREIQLKTKSGKITEEYLPTFRAILVWLAQQENVFLMVDAKLECWVEITSLIQEYGLIDRCLLLTFSLETTKKVYGLLPNAWVSTLVNDAAAFRKLRSMKFPDAKRVAYVNSSTPTRIIRRLQRRGFILTTDLSERRRTDADLLDTKFYQAFAASYHLGILISDFPLRVKRLLSGK